MRAGILTSALIWVIGFTGSAQAGLIFPTASGLSQTQLSLVVSTLPDGNLLYTTTDLITNNNAFAVNGIYEVAVSRNINGNPAQWDNADQLWVLGSQTTKAINASLSISMDRSVTDLAIVPGYGVTTFSSLAAFFVGSLSAGGSANIVRRYEATPGVSSINTGIGLVFTAVPELSSFVLCGIAGTCIAGMTHGRGLIRRRRKITGCGRRSGRATSSNE
jgi:hypothetical protein